MYILHLRWLNTVLWAVSSNSRDSTCFTLDKQTWQGKKQWYLVHRGRFLKIYSKAAA